MEQHSYPYTAFNIFKNLSYFLMVFVHLSPESYSILGVLMIVDTVTGIVRSGVIDGWQTVTSHELSTGILAKGTLILVPLLIALASRGVGFNLTIIASTTLDILILSELYSSLSNIQSIRLRRQVLEFDAVNYVLSKLRDLLENTIKRTEPK